MQYNETSIWLDAGPGSLAELQRHIDIEQIDAIVISHEHVDHWSDVEHLAVACRYIVPRPPVPFYCEIDLTALMNIGPASSVLAWSRIGPDTELRIGAMALSFSRTDHPVPTLAVRVDAGGKSVGYSADAGPGWGLAALGPGLDLAFCEATHLADVEGTVPHMSARQAGESGRAAGVGRLVLTHQWPRVNKDSIRAEGAAAFGSPIELAEAGKRYYI